MNATLRERLIRAEQQFLLAVVSNDKESLKVFFQDWCQLGRDAENTKATGRLDDNTAHILSEVSLHIENMTVCMLESDAMLQESLNRPIGDFIQDTPTSGPSIASRHPQASLPRHLLFSNHQSSAIPRTLGQIQLLDSYAYCWLMQNIHDPYPNSVQTQIIRDASGASVVQVDHWFQEVRDSIGWSKLSHKFFAGSVTATVAAARRVFLERDKNVSFEIVFAFTVVKAYAETLFPEPPTLQGKDVDTGSVQTMAMDQDQHARFLDKSIIDSESIPVPPRVDFLALQEPLFDFSDNDESEEEDMTPPSIAGCKRPLSDDVFTSRVADLGRPQKRCRTCFFPQNRSFERECPPPLPSTLGLSFEQTIPYISATPASSPTPPESSSGPSPTISQNRGCAKDTLECAEGSMRTHVPVHRTRKRSLSQCVSPAASKRHCRPSIPSEQHFETNPMPPSDGCQDLSLPQDRPADPGKFLQPALSPVDSDIPVNLGVFDWNSISDPLAGMAPSISPPAVVYIPSSDLSSQLLEPPDVEHGATTTSSSSSDLGSLQDLSSLLQFPVLAGPPDLSTSFSASSHSGDSSLSLQDIDWSAITDLINLIPPDSTQSSPPLTSSNDPPTPPEISLESLPSSQSCDASEQPLSQLDLSAPPSISLPFGPEAFSEDVDNMFSFLSKEYNDPVADTLFRPAC